jgi:hypothetical protein
MLPPNFVHIMILSLNLMPPNPCQNIILLTLNLLPLNPGHYNILTFNWLPPNPCSYILLTLNLLPPSPCHYNLLIFNLLPPNACYYILLTFNLLPPNPCLKTALLINLSPLVHGLSTHNILPLGQVPQHVGLGGPDQGDQLQNRVIQVGHAWLAVSWYSLVGQTNLGPNLRKKCKLVATTLGGYHYQ